MNSNKKSDSLIFMYFVCVSHKKMSKAGVICVLVNEKGIPYDRKGQPDASVTDPLHITIGMTIDKEETRRSIKKMINNSFVRTILETTWRVKEVYRPKIGGKSIVIDTVDVEESNIKMRNAVGWLQQDGIIAKFVAKNFFEEPYDTTRVYGKDWQRWEHVEVDNPQNFVFPSSFRLVFAFMANRSVDYVLPLSNMMLGCSICGKLTHLMHPVTRQVLCSESCLNKMGAK